MTSFGLWNDPKYHEIVYIILAFLFLVSVIVYLLNKKKNNFIGAWASVKSWWLFAPGMLFLFGFSSPWPLIFLSLTGIYSIKIYFQMVGIYHRSWFVWTSYLFIFGLTYLIEDNNTYLFNLMPMIFLAVVSFIPLLRNSATHMVQYIALSLLGFVFFGWSFLHLGLLLNFNNGVYLVLYIYIIAELAENASFFFSRFMGKHKILTNLSSRVSIEGILLSTLVALLVAWGLRHLLPVRTEPYWIAAGLTAAVAGRLGSMFIAVIRRDLGIKNTGVFIIGRGDIIDRMDKYIFIGPIFYYVFKYLNKVY